jgi:hypothetical protein
VQPLYYNKQGNPITRGEWVRRFSDKAHQVIRQTDLRWAGRGSTI